MWEMRVGLPLRISRGAAPLDSPRQNTDVGADENHNVFHPPFGGHFHMGEGAWDWGLLFAVNG